MCSSWRSCVFSIPNNHSQYQVRQYSTISHPICIDKISSMLQLLACRMGDPIIASHVLPFAQRPALVYEKNGYLIWTSLADAGEVLHGASWQSLQREWVAIDLPWLRFEECYQILDDMTFDLFARMLAAGTLWQWIRDLRLALIAKRAALLFHLQMSRTVSDAGLFRLE